MRIQPFILLLLSIMPVVVQSDEPRLFTDQEGRTVQARIIGHNPSSGRIQLETATGKKSWVDPQVFSAADQPFIENWIAVAPFHDPEVFRITVKESEGEWETVGLVGFTGKPRKEMKTRYTVTLQNMSDSTFRTLRLNYCIYRIKKTGSSTYTDTQAFSKFIGTLEPGEEKEVRLPSAKSARDGAGGPSEEVVGACFRITLPGKDNAEYMREIRFPRSLPTTKYPWQEPQTKKR